MYCGHMHANEQARIHIKLFLNMLYISAFTFGGGFVIVTLMKKKFVNDLKWIDDNEMLDMVALAQSSPGAIAVNAAILVGWKVAGITGMLVAVLGTILPPMILLSILSFIYAAFAANPYVALVLSGMQAGVAAVILDVVISLANSVIRSRSIMLILLMVISFLASSILKVNVMLIILGAVGMGLIHWQMNRGKEEQ